MDARIAARAFVAGLLALVELRSSTAVVSAAPGGVCPGGRYVVDGAPLVPTGAASGDDAIVITVPGDEEGAGPTIIVKSGCAETPVELDAAGGGTKLDVRLQSCTTTGEVRLKASIEPSCRLMSGSFKISHAPVKKGGDQGPTRHFTARLVDFDGRVTGVVHAAHGPARVALPGAEVFLIDHTSGIELAVGDVTDAFGRFEIPTGGPGTFDVCARADGFATHCHAAALEISSASPDSKYVEIDLGPEGGAIRGSIHLADGNPCFADYPAHGVAAVATISSGAGSVATANARGEYVLGGIGDPGVKAVHVECESASLDQAVVAGAAELQGDVPVDFTLPNASPVIELVHAELAGTGVRSASPGTVLTGKVTASDPDGDAIHYRWKDGQERVVSVDSSSVAWPLGPEQDRNELNVLVGDGRGGYAEDQVVVGTSEAGDRHLGTVRDAAGEPLAGAIVRVDEATGESDADGTFRVVVPPATRHVVEIEMPGYAPWSRRVAGGGAVLDVRLRAVRRTIAVGGQPIRIESESSEPFVHIPANGLVDEQGNPAQGEVVVDFHPFDLLGDDAPGGRVAVDASGQERSVELAGAMSLELYDAAGEPLALAPLRRAVVSFKAPRLPPADLPSTMPLFRYDPEAGVWQQRGTAHLDGDRYRGLVSGFSSWSGGFFSDGSACLRAVVDDSFLERPFHLRVSVLDGGVFEGFSNYGEYTVTDRINALTRLPANVPVMLETSPVANPESRTGLIVTTSGPNVSPVEPDYPYDECKTVTLKADLPGGSWLDRLGFGSAASAEQYYQSIGAIPAKDTFVKWLAANGFDEAPSAEDVAFFNPNELGLGRRVNCAQGATGGGQVTVACYNRKYGSPGGSWQKSLDEAIDDVDGGDYVAMEYGPSPTSGGERVTKFYIYGSDGKLKTHTAFDSQGSIKHVPNVCLHCHGHGALDGKQGKFVTLDPHSYRMPASGPFSMASQQERFRELNAMIAFTFHHDGPGWDLMASIYPDGVHSSGAEAIEQPVPPGWGSQKEAWQTVVKPSCRTCHMWRGYTPASESSSVWAMSSHADMKQPGIATAFTCDGQMPNAFQPMLRLWRSSDPFLPDVLAESLGAAPCLETQAAPTIVITAPANQSHVAYGGFNFVTLEATASDAEDGSPCCLIEWRDGGEIVGYGAELEHVFTDGGTHGISAIAYDQLGKKSAPASIQLVVDNDAPSVVIEAPASGATLIRDVPYKVRADGFDPNDPFLDVPCAKLTWKTSLPADGTATGCQPLFTFTTTGSRTITVTATDTAGATATDSVFVTVEEAVPGSPPQAIILEPDDGLVVDPNDVVHLVGEVGDPDGASGELAFQWTEDRGLGESIIGTTKELDWTALQTSSCSSETVTIRFYVTDPVEGTGTASIEVTISISPC